jgi:hypothetical protein
MDPPFGILDLLRIRETESQQINEGEVVFANDLLKLTHRNFGASFNATARVGWPNPLETPE